MNADDNHGGQLCTIGSGETAGGEKFAQPIINLARDEDVQCNTPPKKNSCKAKFQKGYCTVGALKRIHRGQTAVSLQRNRPVTLNTSAGHVILPALPDQDLQTYNNDANAVAAQLQAVTSENRSGAPRRQLCLQ